MQCSKRPDRLGPFPLSPWRGYPNRVAEALDQRPSTAVRPLCNVRREDDTLLRWVCAAPLASNSITDCAAVRHIPIKYPEGTNGRQHDKKEEVRGWGGVMTKVDWRIQCL